MTERASITVAAVSCLLRPADPGWNLAQIKKWAHIAARRNADLVLFNETSATGYWMDSRIRRLAEPLDGPIVRELIRTARETGVVIAAGIAEALDGACHNTHVLVGPEGLLGYHRKSEFPDGEAEFFDAGDDCNVIEVRGCRFGVAVCYESIRPDTCRRLTENGAQVILAPYHNAVSASEIHGGKRPYFVERARENKVWYVACDQCSLDRGRPDGPLVPGAVCFVSPMGEMFAVTALEETGEHVLSVKLDAGAAQTRGI